MAADLEEALLAWLRDQATVTALVDTDTASDPHIHTDVLPQSAKQKRALVFREVSGQHEDHLAGTSDLAHMRVQFDCHAPTAKGAWQLRAALKTALQGFFRGVMEGVSIRGIAHAGDYTTDTPPRDGTAQHRFTRSADFHFAYKHDA